MMQLKHYQQESLVRLEDYLDAALLYGVDGAYRKVQTAVEGGVWAGRTSHPFSR